MRHWIPLACLVMTSFPTAAMADSEIRPNSFGNGALLETRTEWDVEGGGPDWTEGSATRSQDGPEPKDYHHCNGDVCFPGPAPIFTDPVEPVETDDPPDLEAIRTAVREIPMPVHPVHIQPAGRALVNMPQILYTDPSPLDTTVTVLGDVVDVRARPTSWTWNHGDGTSQNTRSPGQAYPRQTLTHTYAKAADAVTISLSTTFAVTYRINGGPWIDLGEPLTSTGSAATLRVAEATSALTRR